MTDVAGPLVPLGRSSLLIRGAETAAGELDVEADCSMVKAFENPTENPNPAETPRETSRETSRAAGQFPDTPKSPFHSIQAADREGKYGSTLKPPQAAPVTTGMPSAAGLEPFGDPDKVNQFCRV